MTGMKIAAGTALASGGVATVAQIVDPQALAGLGVPQLFALVAIVAIAALVFTVCKFVPSINQLTGELRELNGTMRERPCIAGDDKCKVKK